MLLSSWLRRAPPAGAVAWVGVERGEQDATRFWIAVIEALRDAGAVAAGDPFATLAPAPLGTHDELLPQLVEGLSRPPQPVVLIVDDLHELRSPDALGGLERLLAHPPAPLRTVLVSRHDPKLGLHRLRLTGELVEIRATRSRSPSAWAGRRTRSSARPTPRSARC